jgi:hypothetical protein
VKERKNRKTKRKRRRMKSWSRLRIIRRGDIIKTEGY